MMTSPPRQRRQPSPAILSKEIQVSADSVPVTPVRDTPINSKLLSYEGIPMWHQDNEYIRSGYRPETNSTKLCFASWSYVHNETGNIFSHLIPALASFIGEIMLFCFFQNRYPASTIGDQLAFAFFLLTAAGCLGMSATYHTLMNHSASVSNLWLRLDYVGIVILTIGDFVSGIYMVFYCEPTLQKVYWTMVGVYGPRIQTLQILD